jgi:hypothetical protein
VPGIQASGISSLAGIADALNVRGISHCERQCLARINGISPEALYATKRAVNRVADAAGFRTALYAGLDVVGPLYATTTELGAFPPDRGHRGRAGCSALALGAVQGIMGAAL